MIVKKKLFYDHPKCTYNVRICKHADVYTRQAAVIRVGPSGAYHNKLRPYNHLAVVSYNGQRSLRL